jgi:hypothetical protein
MSRKITAKIVLATAQASWLIILIGYLLLRSQWVVLPGFATITCLLFMRCRACSTPMSDERIYRHFKLMHFWDTRIIDECPVCSRSMVLA